MKSFIKILILIVLTFPVFSYGKTDDQSTWLLLKGSVVCETLKALNISKRLKVKAPVSYEELDRYRFTCYPIGASIDVEVLRMGVYSKVSFVDYTGKPNEYFTITDNLYLINNN